MTSTNAGSEMAPALILTSFDRSGSSAIATTLAQHPKVELFMQPFNSGPVRQKMYRLWTDETATKEDVAFFAGLEQGRIVRSYIRSHWFEKSSVQDFVPGHLHIVKTTINHFVTPWSARRFPNLPHWAIWREPQDMLASLIRNDFLDQWYAEAISEILPAVAQDDELTQRFGRFIGELGRHPHIDAAFLIGVRSTVLFRAIPSDQVLSFEAFRQDASKECGRIFARYGLDCVTLDSSADMNIIGKPLVRGASHREVIAPEAVDTTTEIFREIAGFRPQR